MVDDKGGLTNEWGGESRQEWYYGEADEMNMEVDSKDELMHIKMSDLWFSTRRWLVDEKW